MMTTSYAPPSPEFREDLRRLHRDLDAALGELGPVCRLSGRCCRFEEYGHTLFVSSAEIAVLIDEAPAPSRPLDQGATCPWQDADGRCSARDARPLGCRVYFCDESRQDRLLEIGEEFHGRLQALIQRRGLNWDYATLHRHLREARNQGVFRDDALEFQEARRGFPAGS